MGPSDHEDTIYHFQDTIAPYLRTIYDKDSYKGYMKGGARKFSTGPLGASVILVLPRAHPSRAPRRRLRGGGREGTQRLFPSVFGVTQWGLEKTKTK